MVKSAAPLTASPAKPPDELLLEELLDELLLDELLLELLLLDELLLDEPPVELLLDDEELLLEDEELLLDDDELLLDEVLPEDVGSSSAPQAASIALRMPSINILRIMVLAPRLCPPQAP